MVIEPQVTFNQVFRRSPAIVSRSIQGEAVLVPIRQRVGDLDAIYALNETASLVWLVVDGQLTLDQVLARITDEFEVDAAKAGPDLQELIAELLSVGAVERV